VEDLGLTFCAEEEAFGQRTAHELQPGGADTAVTDSNKLLYVHLVADWHLSRRLGKPAAAFAAGLHQVHPILLSTGLYAVSASKSCTVNSCQ
jgi:hypothetical protein